MNLIVDFYIDLFYQHLYRFIKKAIIEYIVKVKVDIYLLFRRGVTA